jgi:hypothetical protein
MAIMKKAGFIFFFLCLALSGFAQTTAPADFFAGKWEIVVSGTPNGEVTFVTNLIRKDGKLSGELINPADPSGRRAITKVTEAATKLGIYFESTRGGEIMIDLTKVDEDTLKGLLMDSFESKARRIKE